MPELKVLPIGTPVLIGKDIIASITAIMIRANNYIQYECSWVTEHPQCEWMDSILVIPIDENQQYKKIGF